VLNRVNYLEQAGMPSPPTTRWSLRIGTFGKLKIQSQRVERKGLAHKVSSYERQALTLTAAKSTIEQKALGLLKAFESAGKSVRSVTIDGRKIELNLATDASQDEFDRIDMRHGKA